MLTARTHAIEDKRLDMHVLTVCFGEEQYDVHYWLDGEFYSGDCETPPTFPSVVLDRIEHRENEIPLDIVADEFYEFCVRQCEQRADACEGDDGE